MYLSVERGDVTIGAMGQGCPSGEVEERDLGEKKQFEVYVLSDVIFSFFFACSVLRYLCGTFYTPPPLFQYVVSSSAV